MRFLRSRGASAAANTDTGPGRGTAKRTRQRQITGRLAPPGAKLPAIRTLEEASMTLVERVAEWPKQWLRHGRAQGVDQQRALLCR